MMLHCDSNDNAAELQPDRYAQQKISLKRVPQMTIVLLRPGSGSPGAVPPKQAAPKQHTQDDGGIVQGLHIDGVLSG